MDILRPIADPYSKPYWSGLREGRILMPRCRACGHVQFPMGPCCSACLSDGFDWIELSGRGSVCSYIIYHHAFHPSLADKLPYNVAEVQLDGGPKVISNIVGIDNDALRSKLPVQPYFDRIDDDLTLLRFT
ncbi:MAG: Zn-ribbon domain-containing OB-fold protein, partial [Lautropia sp.]